MTSNKPTSLLAQMRTIRKAFNCPNCGKSRLVSATAHRGRGTGHRGESHYDATAFESVSAESHCACPGGPVDLAQKREATNTADGPQTERS